MATVYEARDGRLDRAIALKVLPPEFLHDVRFAERFEREARVIAALVLETLRHPVELDLVLHQPCFDRSSSAARTMLCSFA